MGIRKLWVSDGGQGSCTFVSLGRNYTDYVAYFWSVLYCFPRIVVICHALFVVQVFLFGSGEGSECIPESFFVGAFISTAALSIPPTPNPNAMCRPVLD